MYDNFDRIGSDDVEDNDIVVEPFKAISFSINSSMGVGRGEKREK